MKAKDSEIIVRQADSTIKGYLYQFNKSILTILESGDDDCITVEGVIEDIDITSPTSVTTIQCKYHEDKEFSISNVATPILEMLCHFCENNSPTQRISYILYAYYSKNVDVINIDDFKAFLNSTQNKEIMVKYFHRIYNITSPRIVAIANKPNKNGKEKEILAKYYTTNRSSLSPKINLQDFWDVFSYIRAEKLDVLIDKIINSFAQISDYETASSLFYPNAITYVASLSSNHNADDRKTTKCNFLKFLNDHKSILLHRLTLKILDRKQLFKAKKAYLSSYFQPNHDVRVFIFSEHFLQTNTDRFIPFIHEYLGKYFKKKKLQKPPIFLYETKHSTFMQQVILELYSYGKTVNTGMVGNLFIPDSFINNTNCPTDFMCKMALIDNITIDILEQCHVTQLYIIGKCEISFYSKNYIIEELNISNIQELRYLVGLTSTLEVIDNG